MLNTGKIYLHKILGNTYVEHRGKIYLHKILGNMLCWTLWEDWLNKQATLNTLCWTLWEDLFTQNTERILHVEHWEDFFPHITGEYCMLNTVGRFIYTQYWEIRYVEHCGKIYLHKISRNIVCWALWEDLFTQNTEEYCMLSTVGRLFTQNTRDYFMLNTVGRFIYTKYWGILYVEHWGDLFTQNTEEYFMLNTVGRFIYTKYWGITLCWTLWGDLFTQNTEE